MNNKRKVTNDDAERTNGHATKRVRVSRACDQCRAGREKCNGDSPCQTCENQQRQCSYDEQPKKRGIQPNYIRTLELSLALIFRSFPETQRHLSRILSNPQDKDHRLVAYRDTTASDTLHGVWRNSVVARQVEQLLSGLAVEASGSAEPDETVALQHEDHHHRPEPEVSRKQRPANEAVGDVNTAQPVTGFLKLPSDSWDLCEHYFAFTQSWLPIVEKHDVLKLLYNYPAEGLPKAQAAASDHAELWSIITLASLQKSDRESSKYQQVARSLIPDEYGTFRICHVKALLILALAEIAKGAWPSAWILTGSAIRILAYIDTAGSAGVAAAPVQSKHVCLAAFLLERVVAFQTGARMYLHTSQVHRAGFLIEDGLEEWAPWHDPGTIGGTELKRSPARSISTFNRLVRVAACPQQKSFGAGEVGTDAVTTAVFKLLQNASAPQDRVQPCALLAGLWPKTSRPDEFSIMNGCMKDATRQDQAQSLFWTMTGSEPGSTPIKQPFPFVSVINESTQSLVGSTPAQMHPEPISPSIWMGDGASSNLNASNIEPDSDIFEEFALLERVESNAYPNFMQNLGFGPDLDLAEFFGSDYQPTELMLEGLQAPREALHHFNETSGKGIG